MAEQQQADSFKIPELDARFQELLSAIGSAIQGSPGQETAARQLALVQQNFYAACDQLTSQLMALKQQCTSTSQGHRTLKAEGQCAQAVLGLAMPTQQQQQQQGGNQQAMQWEPQHHINLQDQTAS